MSLIINNNEEQRFGYLAATEVTEQWTSFSYMVCHKSNEAIFTNQNHYHFQRKKKFRFLSWNIW